MIHIERTPPPARLAVVLRDAAVRTDAVFHRNRSKQTRFEFPDEAWKAALPALTERFHSKCAYCETPIQKSSGGNVDHFRPKLGAMDLKKRVSPEHYFWLAHEWSNLYLGCGECELNKKTFFPVIGERASIGGAVAEEKPMLVDPCDDFPELHLHFSRDGKVTPESERGAITIELLALNRASLVTARRAAIRAAMSGVTHGLSRKVYLSASRPYAAAIRAAIAKMTRASAVAPPPLLEAQLDALPAAAEQAPIVAAAAEHRTGGFLKTIRIENFKGVEALTLKINPAMQNEQVGWMMLLGENAAGKSSILQAVALALVGRDGIGDFTQESLDAMIRNKADSATISLETSAEPPLVRLKLQRGKKPRYLKGGEGYPGLVLAYGATRIAGDHAAESTEASERRVLNLFNPRVNLTPAEPWLLQLKQRSEEAFDDAAKSLRSLLRIENVETPFTVENDRVMINHGNGPVRVDQLSAGYHAMLGLGVDIMQASPAQTTDKAYVSGVVVLDEIDAHLHPRWKMDVVRLLRSAFPRIQFIVSTHEPLCLRGTREKEVVLMRAGEDKRVEAVTNLPPHEHMRVDQLLTSPLFGLNTTLEPTVETQFREYYALLAKASPTAEEQERIDDYRARLSRQGVLGYTRRDQMIYDIIDRYLAHEPLLTAERRAALEEKTKKKVAAIWRGVTLRSGA